MNWDLRENFFRGTQVRLFQSRASAYYERLGSTHAEAFADMIVFDAVVCNTDRHFGNLGFLLDNKSSMIAAPAPLFDHGLSLFPFAMEDDYANIDSLNQYGKPFCRERMTISKRKPPR